MLSDIEAMRPPAHPARDDSAEKIFVAIDYGTSRVTVAAWLSRRGEQASLIHEIPLHSNYRTAPQLVAYHEDELVWGYDLEKKVTRGIVPEENVIKLLKLYLYEEFKKSPRGERIRQQLKNCQKHDYEVLGAHLKALLSRVKPYFKVSIAKLTRSDDEIDAMELELLILVPACWSRSGTGTMSAAATVAGVKRCQFVSESQVCSSVLNRPGFEEFQQTTTIISADGGGGTLDCASCDIPSIRKGSSGNPIRPTPGRPLLAVPAGSELVDEEFFDWIFGESGKPSKCPEIKSQGGIEKFINVRHSSAAELRWKLAPQFKVIKEKFRNDPSQRDDILLDFRACPSPTKRYVTITLSSEQIRTFFEPTIAIWLSTLQSMLRGDTKAILLSGGFSHNEYLQERLQEHFSGVIEMIMPDEAYELAKPKFTKAVQELFGCVVPIPLPPSLSWGIPSHEEFNPDLHPHCLKKAFNGKTHFSMKDFDKNQIIRIPDVTGHTTMAYDAIEWLIVPSLSVTAPASGFGKASKHIYLCAANDEQFHEVNVVYTARYGRQHEPLWASDGHLNDGLHLIDPVPIFDMHNLEELGYTLEQRPDGEMWYEMVSILLELDVQPGEVKLKLRTNRNGSSKGLNQKNFRVQELSIWNKWMSNMLREEMLQPGIPSSFVPTSHSTRWARDTGSRRSRVTEDDASTDTMSGLTLTRKRSAASPLGRTDVEPTDAVTDRPSAMARRGGAKKRAR